MSTHEFAKYLLSTQDLPLMIEGAGSDDGGLFEVGGVSYLDDKKNKYIVGYFCDESNKKWCYYLKEKI